MTTPGNKDQVPFTLAIEGRIDVEKVKELLETLGRIASDVIKVEVFVGTPGSPKPIEIVEREDFDANTHWKRGASKTWYFINEIAQSNPDFPLRPLEDSGQLEGRISDAIRWLKINNPAALSTIDLLEKIRDSRRSQ
jgi:hypothetical protein